MFWKFNEKAPWISCISDLLADEAVQSMRALPQHRPGFSCYHHSLLVSYTAYCLCRRLGWRAREAARGRSAPRFLSLRLDRPAAPHLLVSFKASRGDRPQKRRSAFSPHPEGEGHHCHPHVPSHPHALPLPGILCREPGRQGLRITGAAGSASRRGAGRSLCPARRHPCASPLQSHLTHKRPKSGHADSIHLRRDRHVRFI